MPVSSLQAALTASILDTDALDSPRLYGFYDLYIRPKNSGDTDYDGTTGNIVDFSSLKGADAPITPQGPLDAWSAGIATTASPFNPPGFPDFSFSALAPGNTYVALITPNPNVVGKTFDGLIGEQLPDTASFVLTLNSDDPRITLGTSVRFEFYALGYGFNDAVSGGPTSKEAYYGWYVDLNAETELPEPMPALTGGGGLLLLFAFAGMRRRRKTS
jgi:MYXO-CTERM domain-containing protein